MKEVRSPPLKWKTSILRVKVVYENTVKVVAADIKHGLFGVI